MDIPPVALSVVCSFLDVRSLVSAAQCSQTLRHRLTFAAEAEGHWYRVARANGWHHPSILRVFPSWRAVCVAASTTFVQAGRCWAPAVPVASPTPTRSQPPLPRRRPAPRPGQRARIGPSPASARRKRHSVHRPRRAARVAAAVPPVPAARALRRPGARRPLLLQQHPRPGALSRPAASGPRAVNPHTAPSPGLQPLWRARRGSRPLVLRGRAHAVDRCRRWAGRRVLDPVPRRGLRWRHPLGRRRRVRWRPAPCRTPPAAAPAHTARTLLQRCPRERPVPDPAAGGRRPWSAHLLLPPAHSAAALAARRALRRRRRRLRLAPRRGGARVRGGGQRPGPLNARSPLLLATSHPVLRYPPTDPYPPTPCGRCCRCTQGQCGIGVEADPAHRFVPDPQPVRGLLADAAVRRIAAGGAHALAADEAGNIYAWGRNREGACRQRRRGGDSTPIQGHTHTHAPLILC